MPRYVKEELICDGCRELINSGDTYVYGTLLTKEWSLGLRDFTLRPAPVYLHKNEVCIDLYHSMIARELSTQLGLRGTDASKSK